MIVVSLVAHCVRILSSGIAVSSRYQFSASMFRGLQTSKVMMKMTKDNRKYDVRVDEKI